MRRGVRVPSSGTHGSFEIAMPRLTLYHFRLGVSMSISRRELIFAIACGTFAANVPSSFAWASKPETNQDQSPAGDAPDDAGPLAKGLSPRLETTAIAAAMEKVGTWELNRTRNVFNKDWTFAALYVGFLAAARSLHDPKYENAMLRMGRKFHWELGPSETFADDQAVGQAYLELYLKYKDEAMIRPTRTRFDQTMQAPLDPAKPLWWWCDALFMAPPVYALLYAATGKQAYLDYMDRQWWITSHFLYDPTECLYFRDDRYFDKREKNGQHVFWSRGNGWVLAGLARVLEHMPHSYPSREKYITQFCQMATKLRSIQGKDGLWRSGLLDPEAYSLPEISGSALITYGIAWGVNNGVLADRPFRLAVANAWSGMLRHIYQSGRLGCIQPPAGAPGHYKPTSSYVYGVGGFLLAGSELEKMTRLHRRP